MKRYVLILIVFAALCAGCQKDEATTDEAPATAPGAKTTAPAAPAANTSEAQGTSQKKGGVVKGPG